MLKLDNGNRIGVCSLQVNNFTQQKIVLFFALRLNTLIKNSALVRFLKAVNSGSPRLQQLDFVFQAICKCFSCWYADYIKLVLYCFKYLPKKEFLTFFSFILYLQILKWWEILYLKINILIYEHWMILDHFGVSQNCLLLDAASTVKNVNITFQVILVHQKSSSVHHYWDIPVSWNWRTPFPNWCFSNGTEHLI